LGVFKCQQKGRWPKKATSKVAAKSAIKPGRTLKDVAYDLNFAFVFYAANKTVRLQTVSASFSWKREN
jgi:hypothetical protein